MHPTLRHAADLQTAVHAVRAGVSRVRSLLPGARPAWVVVELAGTILPRAERPQFFGVPLPSFTGGVPSLEEIARDLDALGRAPWLTGVLFRIEGLHADPATAYALRRAIGDLRRAGKRTMAFLTQLDQVGYYVASAAAEIVAPECADVGLHGLGVSVTFMRDALARIGVRFEKLAIDEYKNAFDTLVRQEMSPAQREQLEALLDRFQEHFSAAIAESRKLSPERVRALIDEGITSATRARDERLVDTVAYEDEIVGPKHRPLAEVRRFLTERGPALSRKRIAVVSLTGAIVTGRSRRTPLPLPPLGGRMSGSETVVAALRAAEADRSTAAIVFFVDSGGGSALASDLIWREVKRIREKKPVVGVMGAVAASGGYYVLAPASRILAAPTTVTGSIGVLTGKLVLEQLFERHGFNAEQIRRGRYALLLDPSRSLGEDERALLARHNAEVYDRFVARVAEGRRLEVPRVREIARGRVWAGSDALKVGLVDELGDLALGIARAREMAGIDPDSAVWDVHAPEELILPSAEDPAASLGALGVLAREHTLLLEPAVFRFS
jgi:protease-4